MFTLLEVGETLTYINNTVTVSNGAVFMDIENLTVENRIQTKSISGSSTGEYGGFGMHTCSVCKACIYTYICYVFVYSISYTPYLPPVSAQLVVSFKIAVLVQFGVRPIVCGI